MPMGLISYTELPYFKYWEKMPIFEKALTTKKSSTRVSRYVAWVYVNSLKTS